MKLCLDRRVAEILDNSRGEVGISIGGNDQAKVHESAEQDFGIFEDVRHILGFYGSFARGAPLIDLEPGFDEGAFGLRKPLNFLWKVWKQEEECEGN